MRRRPLTLTLLLSGILLVSGCTAEVPAVGTPAPPSSSAQSTPAAPVPTADAALPAIATISIGATGVHTLDEAGQVIDSAVFADGPDALVAFLTEATGTAPADERDGDSDEGSCGPPSTISRWGDALQVTTRDTEIPPLYNSTVTVRAAETDSGIRLESSTGFAVGDDGAAVLATLPAEQYIHEYNDLSGPLLFEISGASDDGKSYGGAALVSPDGLISAITAPASLSAFYC